MAIPVVESALKFLDSSIKYLTLLHQTAPIRKMKAAIEEGEKYIQVNEGRGEFQDITNVQRIKYLRHYSKRFFRFN